MAEYKFFDTPRYQDAEWHATRSWAPHIEQVEHRLRLELARGYVRYLCGFYPIKTVLDVGCGDGGLISLLAKDLPHIKFIGYDLAPANVGHGKKRLKNFPNATTSLQNFRDAEISADLVIVTEVLEHLVDPHEFLETINADWLVASSPLNEHYDTDYKETPLHLWGWDFEGYKKIFNDSKKWVVWFSGLYQHGGSPLETANYTGTIFIVARRQE